MSIFLVVHQKYNGKRSDLGKDAAVLRKIYLTAKAQATSHLQDILEPVRKQMDIEALKVVKGVCYKDLSFAPESRIRLLHIWMK